MTYAETVHYLFQALPDFQRVGKQAYKPGLDTARTLDAYYDQPHRRYATIHIAGTNGKGSVSHMLASVLQAAGYRTGLFTSPHLLDFRERIRINGSPIPEEAVMEYVQRDQNFFEKVHASFFEMTSAIALDWFARNEVDIAVIETGLGGRLDSTNIITPILSVITNISLDHTDILGNTLTEIAREKAGIIKEGVPVVLGESQPEIEIVFREKAAESGALLIFAQQKARVSESHTKNGKQEFLLEGTKAPMDTRGAPPSETIRLSTDLTGLYQQKNILTFWSALQQLRSTGWNIPDKAIHSGLNSVVSSTGLMGRWQTIARNPLIICDTAHNPAGIRFTMEQIKQTTHRNLHIVFGVVKDKDVRAILQLLPAEASYYFTCANSPRALPPILLQQYAMESGLQGDTYPTVGEALAAARTQATPQDLIYIGGSTFVVAEVL